MNSIITLLVTMMLTTTSLYGQSSVVQLWEQVPFAKPSDLKEEFIKTDLIRISKVSTPTLEIYQASPKVSTGQAVVICPGGGYHILAYDLEGTDIAKMFNAHGITAIVLKYRLPNQDLQTQPSITPLSDAQQAVRWTRSNAESLNINPAQIGIMGFSAGGHLAASLSTMYDYETVANLKDAVSAKPDFSILVYPVITFTQDYMHKGSREALLGGDTDRYQQFSPEHNVDSDTPPAILIHASDDKGVPVANSISYYQALIANNVKAELHVYDHGGHGFGLATGKGHLASWTDRVIDWMNRLNRDQ